MMNNCDYILENGVIKNTDAENIYKETAEYLKYNPNKSTKEALEETLKNQAFDLLESKTITQLNENKAKEFLNFVNKGAGTPVDYIVRRPSAKNQSNNVETFAASHAEDFNNLLRQGLTKNEESLLSDTANELNIIKAFDGELSGTPYNKIAENLKNYFTFRDTKLITSTAFKHKQLLNDYYFRVVHDSSAISKVSSENWVNFIYDRLDINKTSKLLNVDPNKLKQILPDIYKELESGVPINGINSESLLTPNVKGMAHRSLIFKDLKNQFEYNKAFGEFKNLSQLIYNDFNRSAKQIANAELLGNNPNNFVRNVLRNKSLFKNDLDRHAFKAIYNSYYDSAPSIASPTVRKFTDTLRAVTGLPRLFGALPFYSIADLPGRMLYLRTSGAKVWDAVTAPFVSLAKEASPQEVDFIKHYVDTFFAESFFNRSGVTPPKFLDSASKIVYHGFGLKAIERNQMKGLIAFKCRQLGENASKSFDQLDVGLQQNLSKHGIDASDWNHIRNSAGNTGYVTPEQIEKLNVPSETKTALRRKIRSVFLDAANNAVLSNGMYENALYSMGTKPGTVLGECVRAVMQFKSFGLNFLRRVLIGQYQNAAGLDRRLETAIFYALTTIPLSFASNALLSLSKGVTPTNPFEENTAGKVGYAEDLLFGNLGALMGVINPTGNKSLTEKLLSSPLTKTADKLFDSVIHPTHIPKNAAKILNLDNMPFISILLHSAFDQMGVGEWVPEPYKDPSQDYLF